MPRGGYPRVVAMWRVIRKRSLRLRVARTGDSPLRQEGFVLTKYVLCFALSTTGRQAPFVCVRTAKHQAAKPLLSTALFRRLLARSLGFRRRPPNYEPVVKTGF